MRALTQLEAKALLRDPCARIRDRKVSPPGEHWSGEAERPAGRPPDSWPAADAPGLRDAVVAHIEAGDLEAWLATTVWGMKSHPRVDAALRMGVVRGRIHYRRDLGEWRVGRAKEGT